MSDEHLIQQPIDGVWVFEDEAYWVGRRDVTRIEACSKTGEYCNIPYLRVWSGDICIAEFCQHRVIGVHFAAPKAAS